MPYPVVMPDSPASAAGITHPSGLRPRDHAHPGAMTKLAKRKRSRSEVAEERVRVSEVMLRGAALAYAAVDNLDPPPIRAGVVAGAPCNLRHSGWPRLSREGLWWADALHAPGPSAPRFTPGSPAARLRPSRSTGRQAAPGRDLVWLADDHLR